MYLFGTKQQNWKTFFEEIILIFCFEKTNNNQILGVGAGQMSRIDSVKNAIRKIKEFNLSLDGAIMASDAFFPFSDSLELASEFGIKSVIQPGGSRNDSEVIETANTLGMSMVFTSVRHFYH